MDRMIVVKAEAEEETAPELTFEEFFRAVYPWGTRTGRVMVAIRRRTVRHKAAACAILDEPWSRFTPRSFRDATRGGARPGRNCLRKIARQSRRL